MQYLQHKLYLLKIYHKSKSLQQWVTYLLSIVFNYVTYIHFLIIYFYLILSIEKKIFITGDWFITLIIMYIVLKYFKLYTDFTEFST